MSLDDGLTLNLSPEDLNARRASRVVIRMASIAIGADCQDGFFPHPLGCLG